MEGFVEWSIIPDKLPLIYVQYGEGGELIRSWRRRSSSPTRAASAAWSAASTPPAISSAATPSSSSSRNSKRKLREACEKQGIEILQALVRDIVPPDEIKNPINEREVAKQQILSLEQQIQVAKSQAELATQTEMANAEPGDRRSEQAGRHGREEGRAGAGRRGHQGEAGAGGRASCGSRRRRSRRTRWSPAAQAEANVILLNKQAEAEPLRQQVAAFGDGKAYAQLLLLPEDRAVDEVDPDQHRRARSRTCSSSSRHRRQATARPASETDATAHRRLHASYVRRRR